MPEAGGVTILITMWSGIRRLLMCLGIVGLVAGNAFAVAVPPPAPLQEMPCHHDAHDHDDQPDQQPGHSRVCCFGICAAVPAVPAEPPSNTVRLPIRMVIYWPAHVIPAGHDILPDPAPPRTIA